MHHQKKYDAEYPQYARLFRFLDAVGAVFTFLRMIPANAWGALCWIYLVTLYRAFWKICQVGHLRRVTGRWII